MKTLRMRRGFTLVELLVTMAILAILCLVLASFIDTVRRVWSATTSKVEQFREAREGFEAMTRRLSQATLNPFWDYERDANENPLRYTRQSELRFRSGPGVAAYGAPGQSRPAHGIFFQSPLGTVENSSFEAMSNLLNTVGYFIELGDDSATRPPFLTTPTRTRFRLMEFIEPSEELTLYQYTSGRDNQGRVKNLSYTGDEWFRLPLQRIRGRVVAENIIALVILPRFADSETRTSGVPFRADDLAPNYHYDSSQAGVDPETNTKHQLPPILQVAIVAIDEASAARMDAADVERLRQKIEGLFQDASRWQTDLFLSADAAGGSQDSSLEGYLIDNRINYRIFTTNIGLKSAKWSRE